MAKIIPQDEKVFMVSKSTNTTYSGSAALKAMQEWYTMEDVANSVLPYKVFTALLTQSGESDELNQNLGSLTKGISYYFNGTGGASADFSNVGVTNVVDGEWFIATQTAEPINWDGWNVSYNTGAPVATILENTIGNIWFTYVSDGDYYINTSNNGFSTFEKIFSPMQVYNAVPSVLITIYNDSNSLEFVASGGDNSLNNTTIEIRVYN